MGRRAQFNSYRVIDGVAHLDILDRQGNVKAVALVDEADLPRLLKDGRRWSAGKLNTKYGKLYVMRANKVEGSTYLHRFIIGAVPEGMTVDHINGDTMDNRRENLRVVSRYENAQNRDGAQQNNKLGVRGVYYCSQFRRPYVIQLARRKIFYMRVTTLNIARITAEMARVQHWGTEAA